MACCGNQRAQFSTSAPAQREGEQASTASPSPRVVAPVELHFEYVGQTGMTVTGPITGRRYRFDHPGAVLSVDGRDGPSLAAVPNLRRAKAPAGSSHD